MADSAQEFQTIVCLKAGKEPDGGGRLLFWRVYGPKFWAVSFDGGTEGTVGIFLF